MTSTLHTAHLVILVAFASGCVSEVHAAAPRSETSASTSESDPATPLGDDGIAPRHAHDDLWRTDHRVPTAAIVGTSIFVGLIVAGIVAGAVALSQHGPAASGDGARCATPCGGNWWG